MKRVVIISLVGILLFGLSPMDMVANANTKVNFIATELLGRPTDSSITVNALAETDLEVYFEYGTDKGTYDSQTVPTMFLGGEPIEVVLDELDYDTRYYYRMCYRQAEETEYSKGEEHSFHTQRSPDSTFTFLVQSDSHNNGGLGNVDLYTVALENEAADNADFMIDLGDNFYGDLATSELDSVQLHLDQRPYLGIVGCSTALFFALGNHDGEWGSRNDGTSSNRAVWATNARKLYYPNPAPDDFYTGDTTEYEFIGLREAYYAWEWGDALFVVLDPYWNTLERLSGNHWDWTLGYDQYIWLRNTLESSNATFKFVFSHQLVGSTDFRARGGIEMAIYGEWGGYDSDGTSWGFDRERPGWGGKPIHQLMIDSGVTVYFHGHDHAYAYQVLDGIVYQLCPMPSQSRYGSGKTDTYDEGFLLNNSGYLRVTVSRSEVTIDYVRAYLPGDGINREVTYTYTINANCNTDYDCDDGLFCNGAETCISGSCRTGEDPCVGMVCNEDNDECIVNTPNQPPIAEAGPDQTGDEGHPVIFDSSGSYDPDGTIASYSWNFGDGNSGSGASTTHTYTQDDSYTVTLTVTDGEGAIGVDTTTVNVADTEPTATFSYLPGFPSIEGPVQFTDDSYSYDGITSWNWNFGNTSTSSAQNPICTYTSPGTYTVTLTVGEDDTDEDIVSCDITIFDHPINIEKTYSAPNQPPVADPSGPYAGIENVPISFDGSGSYDLDGTITSYSWNFGDGNSASGVKPTHSYANCGTYIVTLIVNDGSLDSDPVYTTVDIVKNPSKPVELFFDSFEDGTLDNWAQDGQNDWLISTQRSVAGRRSAEIDGSASDAALTLNDPIDLAGVSEATLTFSWFIERRVDSGEYLALDIWNGTTWIEAARLRGNVDTENIWHDEAIKLGNYLVDDFKLRFRGRMSSRHEDANLDVVRIVKK